MSDNFSRCLKLAIPLGAILWAIIGWLVLSATAHAEANPDAHSYSTGLRVRF